MARLQMIRLEGVRCDVSTEAKRNEQRLDVAMRVADSRSKGEGKEEGRFAG